jgi:hypothetical protein
MAETSTASVWSERVEAWRASGERAEVFSRRAGYAASTLRWWSSKLKRELGTADPELAPTTPEVRLARVVRTVTPPVVAGANGTGAVVIDVVHADVRITVEAGTPRETLMMVLEVLGVGGAR